MRGTVHLDFHNRAKQAAVGGVKKPVEGVRMVSKPWKSILEWLGWYLVAQVTVLCLVLPYVSRLDKKWTEERYKAEAKARFESPAWETHILDTCGIEVLKLWHEQKRLEIERGRVEGTQYRKIWVED